MTQGGDERGRAARRWAGCWLGWPLHEEMQVTSTAFPDMFPWWQGSGTGVFVGHFPAFAWLRLHATEWGSAPAPQWHLPQSPVNHLLAHRLISTWSNSFSNPPWQVVNCVKTSCSHDATEIHHTSLSFSWTPVPATCLLRAARDLVLSFLALSVYRSNRYSTLDVVSNSSVFCPALVAPCQASLPAH